MLSVDRIENGFAVVTDENGIPSDIPSEMINGGFREGDILVPDGGGFRADRDITEERRGEIRKLEESLWE